MFLRRWWPTGLTLAAVLYITLWPDPVGSDDLPLIPGLDKIIHAVMMGGLTSAILFDYRRNAGRPRRINRRFIILTALLMTVFSVADEWAQEAMNVGRSGDPLDFMADCAGILLAILAAPPVLHRMFLKTNQPKT